MAAISLDGNPAAPAKGCDGFTSERSPSSAELEEAAHCRECEGVHRLGMGLGEIGLLLSLGVMNTNVSSLHVLYINAIFDQRIPSHLQRHVLVISFSRSVTPCLYIAYMSTFRRPEHKYKILKSLGSDQRSVI
jgi:hypothetical protein